MGCSSAVTEWQGFLMLRFGDASSGRAIKLPPHTFSTILTARAVNGKLSRLALAFSAGALTAPQNSPAMRSARLSPSSAIHRAQNPDDLLIAESAAFDLSVSLRNRLYRKLATFQGGTSSGYIKRSQLCAYQKGPELVCLRPELSSSIKVDAGTGYQRSQYVEVAI